MRFDRRIFFKEKWPPVHAPVDQRDADRPFPHISHPVPTALVLPLTSRGRWDVLP